MGYRMADQSAFKLLEPKGSFFLPVNIVGQLFTTALLTGISVTGRTEALTQF